MPFSTTLEDVLSIEEMKVYLKGKNKMLAPDIMPHEVQELYELTLVENNQKYKLDDVPFPVHCSKSLEMKDNRFGFGELVASFEIRNGGQFINLPSLNDEMIAPIINLFTSIVRYDDISKRRERQIVPDFMVWRREYPS